jgi:hypothetical protein
MRRTVEAWIRVWVPRRRPNDLASDMERSLLRLDVDASSVLADHTHRHNLQTTEE